MKNLALANLFYYQNPMTQQPSSHAISVQQICRVLCPASASASSRTSGSASASAGSTTSSSSIKSFLHSTSMVLAYDPSSQTFDPDGWKAIQDVPILKEASSLWYYNNHNDNDQQTTTTTTTTTMKKQQQQQQQQEVDTHHAHATSHNGPISCRELAVLYYNHQQQQQQQQQNKMAVTDDTRVWSPSPTFQHRDWMCIAELPDLITAMEAFEDCIHVCVDDMLDPKIVMDRNENNKNVDKSGSRQRQPQQQQQQQQQQQDRDRDKRVDSSSSEQNAKDLLHDFFSSTGGVKDNDIHHIGNDDYDYGDNNDGDDDDDANDADDDEIMEEYQSDGGTMYIKKYSSGEQWIKMDAVSSRLNSSSSSINRSKQQGGKLGGMHVQHDEFKKKRKQQQQQQQQIQKSKSKKPKFKAKNAKCWIYVTNLPLDTTEEEVAEFFKKVGVLDLNPETQKPRIKLYRDKKSHSSDDSGGGGGKLKGDASICYARPESVDLALHILDDALFRTVDAMTGKYIGNVNKIKVQRAKFEQHGEEYNLEDARRRKVSDKKRKVARLAKLQAVGWDDGENGRITGGLKGLRIIVLKNVFDAVALRRMAVGGEEDKEDEFLKDLETDLRTTCDEFGTVEKITICYKGRIDGVVIVKFTQPTAAGDAIVALNGRELRGRTMEAVYWDGVTDYTVHNHDLEAKEAEKRLDEFGHWLENQDLPEEFQLQVEDS